MSTDRQRYRETEIHTDLVLEVAPPEVGHLKSTHAMEIFLRRKGLGKMGKILSLGKNQCDSISDPWFNMNFAWIVFYQYNVNEEVAALGSLDPAKGTVLRSLARRVPGERIFRWIVPPKQPCCITRRQNNQCADNKCFGHFERLTEGETRVGNYRVSYLCCMHL